MAASLQSRFGEDAKATPGSTGQFDVLVNGKLIFSKAQTHRFPNDGEVETMFAALKDGKEPPPPEEAKPGFVGRLLERLRN